MYPVQSPRAEGQMSPCTFLAKIRKAGLFDKDGGDEKNTSLSQMSAGEILLGFKVRAVMTQGWKGANDCPFSPFPVFHLQHVNQIWKRE